MEDADERLAAFSRYAYRSVDIAGVVARAVDVTLRVLGVPKGGVVRIVGRRPARLVVVQASAGLDVRLGEPYELDAGLAHFLRSAEPLVIEDRRGDARFTTVALPGLSSRAAFLAATITVDGYPWGRLVAADDEPRRFLPEQVALIERVAALTGASVERSRWQRVRTTAAMLSGQPSHPAQSATEVALLDRTGVIVWVNRAWLDFARENGGNPERTGVGMSYLECCDAAGDPAADDVAEAVRLAVRGELPAAMLLRLPCHSPTTSRWYDVLISSRLDDDGDCLGATVTLSRSEAQGGGPVGGR